jgi:hypothetical protein
VGKWWSGGVFGVLRLLLWRLSFVIAKRYDDHEMKPWIIVSTILFSVGAAFCGPAPELTVSYKGKQLVLTSEEPGKLPSAEADAAEHQNTHHYSGVFVRDVLGLVGAPSSDSLRGNAMNLVVRVAGLDNYSVVFSLAEFDPAFNDRPIILLSARMANRYRTTPRLSVW